MSSINLEYRIAGYVCVELRGSQIQRFLNICYFHNIEMKDLILRTNGADFTVQKQYIEELKELGDKYHVVILEKKHGGVPYFFQYYGKRWGFLLGGVACYSFLTYMSGGVWEMEFKGNRYHSEDALISYLEEQGVVYGTRMSKMDCEQMELQLRKRYNDIAWCSLQQEGCKLTLTLTESNLDVLAQTEVPDNTGTDGISIVADRDATIVHMVTRSGEPAVVIGQQVVKGDVLVQGYLTYKDDFDTITGYKALVAQADIIGTYSMVYEQRLSLIKQQEETILTNYYELGPINKIFPHLLIRDKVKFRHDVEENYSFDEGMVILENRYYEQLEIWKEKGYEVIEKNLNIEDNNNEIIQTGTLTLQGPIGEEAPCTIPEVSEEINELDGN